MDGYVLSSVWRAETLAVVGCEGCSMVSEAGGEAAVQSKAGGFLTTLGESVLVLGS